MANRKKFEGEIEIERQSTMFSDDEEQSKAAAAAAPPPAPEQWFI